MGFSLEVDEKELNVQGSIDSIQFENYGGPHAVIESAHAITNIGTELGTEVSKDILNPSVIKPQAKYSLIHAVDNSDAQGLEADILVLNENAAVDHIRNLRRIVTGYLQAAYGYNAEDAGTIAVYVTIYNAVYRGQIETFRERYSPAVMKYLEADKVGLSTDWRDWAGKTQIVIPLNDIQSDLSAVDTTTISDDNVVEALRKEPEGTKSVAARENMADLKEREAATANTRAQEAQKNATQQRAKGNTPAAERSGKAAQTQQRLADRKAVEAKSERTVIQGDKSAVKAKPVPETKNNVTGLFVSDETKNLYTLITVDGKTGAVITRSPVKQIRGKSAVFTVTNCSFPGDDGNTAAYPQMYLAVCGLNEGNSAVRLCLIDAQRLELCRQSQEVLADNTEIAASASTFYVVFQSGSQYLVGAYDKNVNLIAQSTVPVSPSSPLNIIPEGLMVTDSEGLPRLLNLTNLQEVWSTKNSSKISSDSSSAPEK